MYLNLVVLSHDKDFLNLTEVLGDVTIKPIIK